MKGVQIKLLSTPEEATNVSRILEKNISVGDVLCNKYAKKLFLRYIMDM